MRSSIVLQFVFCTFVRLVFKPLHFLLQPHPPSDGLLPNTPLFLKIHKYLLFGWEVDRRCELLIAISICNHAKVSFICELLTLVHKSVLFYLADSAAISFLGNITHALISVVVIAAFLNDVLDDRVLNQCPPVFFGEQADTGVKPVGNCEAVAMRIDVALLWN